MLIATGINSLCASNCNKHNEAWNSYMYQFQLLKVNILNFNIKCRFTHLCASDEFRLPY